MKKDDIRIAISKESAKKSSRKKLIRALLIIAVALAIMLIVLDFLFFKIENITVSGSNMYNKDEIISSSGIEVGDSFLSVIPKNVQKEIKTLFPAIKQVTVKRHFPQDVEIILKESTPKMYIAVGEYFYTLDENLVVLEKYESHGDVEAKGMLRVFLPQVSKCITGQTLQTYDMQISETLTRLFEQLEEYNLLIEAKDVDLTDKFNITFKLSTKYTVKLGSMVDSAIKLEFLCGIIEELDENDVGVIDLSSGDIREAIFSRE